MIREGKKSPSPSKEEPPQAPSKGGDVLDSGGIIVNFFLNYLYQNHFPLVSPSLRRRQEALTPLASPFLWKSGEVFTPP